jgi:O-antigen ligase
MLTVLGAFLVLTALTGGGSRADIWSLLILRPVSAFVLAYAVVFYGKSVCRAFPKAMWLVVAIFALVISHLIPLPPAVWTMLPGRDIIADSMSSAQISLPWLPLSMSPSDTWNALFSLMTPSAVLILALASQFDHLVALMRGIIVGLILSGLLGLLQILGPSNNILYIYELTNGSSAVGLFANRNHQAMALACIFPLLAMHISLLKESEISTRFQKRLALAAAVLFVPLILVTGSRAGLLSMAIGLAGAAWVFCEPHTIGRTVRNRGLAPAQVLIIAVAVVVLFIVTLLASRAEAIDRLLAPDTVANIRTQALPVIMEASWAHFPFGSGIGSFVPVYQIFEPGYLLSDSYLNHAHNEFAEVLMTGGLPALAILLFLIVAYFQSAIASLPRYSSIVGDVTGLVVQRTGLVIIFLFVIGSVSDYPLRTPLIAVLVSIACAAALLGRRRMHDH